jgi:hypothetical protein
LIERADRDARSLSNTGRRHLPIADRDQLQDDGVNPAGVFSNMAEAKAANDYDVILDSVSGDTPSLALTALTRWDVRQLRQLGSTAHEFRCA